jgi:hypothetical protein
MDAKKAHITNIYALCLHSLIQKSLSQLDLIPSI